MISSLLRLIKDISQVAASAVLSIVHSRHEHTCAALFSRTLAPQSLNLAITVDLVVLEHSQLGLLALVLDLFGRGVHLLLALLGATTEAEDQVEGGFLLDVVVRKGASIFELLAGEDQALLVGRDSFLV